MKKKILLLMPENTAFRVDRLHLGLCLMADRLVHAGHEVKIVDYSFLRWNAPAESIPSIEQVIREFHTDVIGISTVTQLHGGSIEILDRVHSLTTAPVIIGGPHVTFFPEDFESDRRVDYIVRGEADCEIVQIVENAVPSSPPKIIECTPPRGTDIPKAHLDVAVGKEFLTNYQIQLSRGCPYQCSFCSIPRKVSGRLVRKRSIEDSIEEITLAKKRFPGFDLLQFL